MNPISNLSNCPYRRFSQRVLDAYYTSDPAELQAAIHELQAELDCEKIEILKYNERDFAANAKQIIRSVGLAPSTRLSMLNGELKKLE